MYIKTTTHQEWLLKLNSEDSNYYKRCIEAEKVIKQQQIMLTEKDNMCQRNILEITRKDAEIDRKDSEINRKNIELDTKDAEIKALKEIIKNNNNAKFVPETNLIDLGLD